MFILKRYLVAVLWNMDFVIVAIIETLLIFFP